MLFPVETIAEMRMIIANSFIDETLSAADRWTSVYSQWLTLLTNQTVVHTHVINELQQLQTAFQLAVLTEANSTTSATSSEYNVWADNHADFLTLTGVR